AIHSFEQALRAGGPEAGFELLAQKFREEKNYPRLFETRLMKKRHELGLPLIQVNSFDELAADKRRPYEEAFLAAAPEVGHLFLADGDIPRAWSYFRAVGEPAPVAAALEKLAPEQANDGVIEVAFHERVHPRKGFEMVLAAYGISRAISNFGQYPAGKDRQECLRLLVRTLYRELVENLKRTIAQREGEALETESVSALIAGADQPHPLRSADAPEAERVSALIAGRDWLFEDNAYYVDTSHVVSILRFSLDLTDRETLILARELADYGRQLAPLFQYKGQPPFEDVYVDHGVYLRALLGEDVDLAIAHFRQKVAAGDPNEAGTGPAQVLVGLLARLGRYREAIETSLEHLRDADLNQLACPSVMPLCQLARDYDPLVGPPSEPEDFL